MRNRTRRATGLVALAAALALFAAGCAQTSNDGSGDGSGGPSMSLKEVYTGGIVGVEGDPGEPVNGGTLVVAAYAEPRSLDPTVTIPNGAAGGNALAAVYGVLMRYDYEKHDYVPLMAKSLEHNDDFTQWTLHLREGVEFSNGQPFNAQAVIGSINYYIQNQGFGTLVLSNGLKSMEALDKHTVRFTLTSPWSSFPSQLATGPGMIVAPAGLEGGPENFKPIGAGPYMKKSYTPGEELILVRNPDYWGGQVHLERIKFVWLGSDKAKMEALKAGDVDVANIRYSKAVIEARRAGRPGIMHPVGTNSILWINSRQGHPGHDPRIRQAIVMAIKPEVYVKRLASGVGWATRSLYIPTLPYYEEVDTPEYNPQRAKELVQAAVADGVDPTITYVGQANQRSRSAALAIKAQLERVGFTVKLDLLTSITEQIKRIYVTHEYDLAVAGLSVGPNPYSGLYTNLHSKSPQNPSGYGSKKMDRLLTQLQGASGEKRQQILTQIHQVWQEDLPGVVLMNGGFFQTWAEDVHGIVASGYNLMLFHDAWKEK